MQITPATAKAIEDLSGGSNFQIEDLSDPDLNIRYGTFYLRHLLDKFDGNEVAAIAAYNGGETNVAEWGGSDLTREDIEFPETRHYVDDVLDKRNDYRNAYGSELGL
jgi:soluble lytic murein transglycosylase